MTCTVLYLLLLRKVICILNSVFSCAVAESGTSRTSRVQLWPPSSLPSRLLQLPGTENQAQRTWENTSKYSRCCEGRVEELCFWLLNSLCWPMEEHQATRLRICRCWMFIHATQAKAWCWNLSHAASKVGSLKFANGSTIRTQSCKYQTDVKVDLKLYKFTAFKAFKDKEMNHSGTRMVLEYCGNHQCSNLCRTWWLFLSTVATTSRNQGSTSPPATERSSNSKICQAVDALMLFPSQIPTRYIYIYSNIPKLPWFTFGSSFSNQEIGTIVAGEKKICKDRKTTSSFLFCDVQTADAFKESILDGSGFEYLWKHPRISAFPTWPSSCSKSVQVRLESGCFSFFLAWWFGYGCSLEGEKDSPNSLKWTPINQYQQQSGYLDLHYHKNIQ